MTITPLLTLEQLQTAQKEDDTMGPIIRAMDIASPRPMWEDLSTESAALKTLGAVATVKTASRSVNDKMGISGWEGNPMANHPSHNLLTTSVERTS